MDEKDGGPAYPEIRIRSGDNYNPPTKLYYPGMTLRDYFAGQALAGAMSIPYPDGAVIDAEAIRSDVKICYAYADAMLAARKGGQHE